MESVAAGGKGASGPRPPLGHQALPAGRVREALAFAAGAVAAALVLLGSSSVLAPPPVPNIVAVPSSSTFPPPVPAVDVADGPRTFYDDPTLSYALLGGAGSGHVMTDWDAKRAAWLRSRGLDAAAVLSRVVMVSGSQPDPCRAAGGDHLLLRFLKNKLDYCRLHPGVELLYNTAHLEPSMVGFWAKIPVLRAAMLAHPEAEWLWWVDADAVFTDMDFSLPLDRYDAAGYNLVVYGWDREVFGERSWVGLNAGVFLIRNCQWSLDLMDAWAGMGPAASPETYARWGRTLKAELKGKTDDVSDDQSALVYLLAATADARWRNATFLENGYFFQGYWAVVVDRLDGAAERYEAVERRRKGGEEAALRRRHAEREHLTFAAARNDAVRKSVPGPDGGGESGWRRPFVTHFTGCNPCGGERNPAYSAASCRDGMRRALNFADDQVLRAYGFRHAAPLSDSVRPLPFDYPLSRV